MADNNHLPESEAIRELSKFTDEIVKRFSELAISYNINVITGSMPAASILQSLCTIAFAIVSDPIE